jgi:hypothetical protein
MSGAQAGADQMAARIHFKVIDEDNAETDPIVPQIANAATRLAG